jgi:hypothetical protein
MTTSFGGSTLGVGEQGRAKPAPATKSNKPEA